MLDLQKPNRSINIELMRNDDRAREINFSIMSNGKKLDTKDIEIATIKGVKPDGTIIYSDCAIKEDGTVVYEISDNMASVEGKVTLMLELWSMANEMIQSFEFYILVKNQLFDENDFMSTNDLGGFKSYMTRAQAAANAAEYVKNAFEVENGSLTQIKQEYENTLDEYNDFYDDLKHKADTGYFNGAQGIQGENGRDAVVMEAQGVMGFEIEGTNLILSYYTEEIPPLRINEDGHLVLE